MSSYETKRAVLTDRLNAIDSSLSTLQEQFAEASFPAAVGDKNASKQLAAVEQQIDNLVRERKSLVMAGTTLEKLIASEASDAAAAQRRARELEARKISDAVMALHVEIDAALSQLREMFERRGVLLADLARTEVASSIFIAKLSSRGPATAAACACGIQRYLDLAACPAASARPLTSVNEVLLSIGKSAEEAPAQ